MVEETFEAEKWAQNAEAADTGAERRPATAAALAVCAPAVAMASEATQLPATTSAPASRWAHEPRRGVIGIAIKGEPGVEAFMISAP
jgi:hypothetical protein